MDLAICAAVTLLGTTGLSTAWNTYSSLQTVVSLFIVQYVAVKIYRIVLYPRYFSAWRHLPGPKNSNILLGEEINKFTGSTPVSHQLEWSKTWPDAHFIRYLSIAGKEVLMCNSIATYKAVLQTYCYDMIKPPFFVKILEDLSGNGLIFVEGDHHKLQRQLMARPFSVPSTRKLLPLFHRKAKALANVFDDAVNTKAYGSMDVSRIMSKAALDIIGVAALGVELDQLSGTGPGFADHYYGMLHQSLLGRAIWVVNAFVPIRKFLPLEENRRWMHSKDEIRKMLLEHTEMRIRDLSLGASAGVTEESRDLLTYLLEEARDYKKETGKTPWTEKEIVENLITFTAAGHETSATMLTWAIYEFCVKQDLQDSVRAEVQSLLKTSPQPTFDEISNLPLLHNFCREILRVYSPIFMVTRQTVKDVVIEGLHIPKGTQIDLPTSVIHFHPHVWGTDSYDFRPDRWNNLTGDAASPYAWEPFIQGPRQCPGKNFAMSEVKAFLIELLKRFHFIGIEKYDGSGILMTDDEAKLGNDVKPQNPAITITPAGGLTVRFNRI